jgi:hypothetical protein
MKAKSRSMARQNQRRFRIKLMLCTSVALALLISFSTAYAQNLRMEPAQRQLVDGPRMSQRDMARSQFNRSKPIRGRGRAYDEIRSASDTAFWQKKGKKKSVKRVKRAKRKITKVKTSN